MLKIKKGIKGQMYIPLNENSNKWFYENINIFKAVCERDFEYCAFNIYDAEYNEEEVIIFEFDIRDRTVKECNASFSRFKKEIKNHFGFKAEQILVMKYEKID